MWPRNGLTEMLNPQVAYPTGAHGVAEHSGSGCRSQ